MDQTLILYLLLAIVAISVVVGYILKFTLQKKVGIDNKIPFAIEKLIDYLGGIDNLISCTNTATRLNVKVKDTKIVKTDRLSELGVSGIVEKSDGYSLIFGSLAVSVKEALEVKIL